MSKKNDQKQQHINVFVRTRPFNAIEAHTHNVTEIHSEKKEIRIRHGKTINRAFVFDGVFGPETKQIHIYKAVVEPLIQEVLMGYNCTVFAYGQTSTGKTYTMEGKRTDMDCEWDKDPSAGIIPRSLHQMFEELHKEENVEFSVHVSFLELYNEELFDLLSLNFDVHDMPKLKLYEDANRKGSVVIQGLEEIKVNSKDEVYEILERGTQRRQTTSTLLNASSSRSHTIFSITVHIKENTIDGEELLKVGKLNLVDLAGSENIGRSGASQKAAREAGNINQSLLTLGRVITALVEKHPHVPYRESKLTRLLQDSLGGHTKTSIIATVSPASSNVDETISTLDYAQRAKCITIKPEANQKTTKRALIQLYTEEIVKLKNDLEATRNKNGIYLHPDNYSDMQKKIEDLTNINKKLTEDNEEDAKKISSLGDCLKVTETNLKEMTRKWTKADAKCQKLMKKLDEKTKALQMTQQTLCQTAKQRDENQYIINIQNKTEEQLSLQANKLLQSADESTKDVVALHQKISRKTGVEKTNEEQCEKFCSYLKDELSKMNTSLMQMADEQKGNLNSVSTDIGHALELYNKYHQDFVNINNAESSLGNFFAKFKQQIESNIKLFSVSHESRTTFCGFNVENINNLKNLNEKLLNELNELEVKDSTVRSDFISKILNLEKLLIKIQNQTKFKIKELETQFKLSSETHQMQTHNMIDQFYEFCTTLKEKSKSLDEQTSLMDTRDDAYKVEMEEEVNKIKSELAATQRKLESELAATQEKLSVIGVSLEKISDIRKANCEDKKRQISEIRELNTQCCKRIKLEEEKFSSNVKSWDEQENMKRSQLEKFSNDVNNEEESSNNKIIESCKSIVRECENEKSNFEACYQTSKDLVNKQKECLLVAGSKTAEENEMLAQNWNKYQVHVEEFKTATFNQLNHMESKINTHKEYFSKSQQRLDTTVNATKEITNSISSIKSEFSKRNTEVENFFSNTLQKDKPTGLTPERKDYNYPRTFASTSPPERLLKRYREQLCSDENSAIKLSLDINSDNSFDNSSSELQIEESETTLTVPYSKSPESDECFESCTPRSSQSAFNSKKRKSKENINVLGRKPSRLPKRRSFKKKTSSYPKTRSTTTRIPLVASNRPDS